MCGVRPNHSLVSTCVSVCRENRNRLTQIMLLKSLLQVSPSGPVPALPLREEFPSEAKDGDDRSSSRWPFLIFPKVLCQLLTDGLVISALRRTLLAPAPVPAGDLPRSFPTLFPPWHGVSQPQALPLPAFYSLLRTVFGRV